MKSINEIVKTINDEIFQIKNIETIEIFLFNDDYLIFSNVMYILKLTINLINTSKLYRRDIIVIYLIKKLCEFQFQNENMIIMIDLNDDFFVFRIKINMSKYINSTNVIQLNDLI